MSAPAASTYAKLTSLLPPRLTRFFARYPPGTCTTAYTNPFKPTYQPTTQKWHNPVYSLRRQAELCKLARSYGVEELLPMSNKRSDIVAEKKAKREERVRSMVPKGKWEERTLKARIEMRKQAMAKMPSLIDEWKRRNRSKGWKDYPTGRARF